MKGENCVAKRRIARPTVTQGKLYQLQAGPRGGKVWEVVEETRRGVFRTRRVSRRPKFGPSDVLLDFTGAAPRQYVGGETAGGRFGRLRAVPFGLDPSTGVVDEQEATFYVVSERARLLDEQARDRGERHFRDQLRVFFVPDRGDRVRRFSPGSWERFVRNEGGRYSKAKEQIQAGRWVLAEEDEDGALGVVHAELGEGEL